MGSITLESLRASQLDASGFSGPKSGFGTLADGLRFRFRYRRQDVDSEFVGARYVAAYKLNPFVHQLGHETGVAR
jgi:hypothetical protein